jgi:hypothetical protein
MLSNVGGNMKKLIICIAIIGAITFANALPVGLEGGAGYVLANNSNVILEASNHFFINGGVLINITDNLYVRTQLARLSFYSGGTLVKLGTMSPIDLMLFFPSSTFNYYGLTGIDLTTGGEATYFGLRAGAGVEFKFNEARVFPFVEAVLDLMTGGSNTENAITIKGGIRVK